MQQPKKLSLSHELARLRNTSVWSIEGLWACWRDEKSFRQWSVLNLINWGLVAYFNFTPAEMVLLICLGILVLVTELLNSAIENTVDYFSKELHPLAKKAKDMASAAVMITGLLWGLGWLLILFA